MQRQREHGIPVRQGGEDVNSGTHESLVRDEDGRLKSPITVNVADFQLAEPLPAHLVEAYFGVSV